MQVSSGMAYFGDEKIQGSLKDKVRNAIDSDITSIQVKNSDIKAFTDFEGYAGEITCYLNDIKWDKAYFDDLYSKLKKLHVIGMNNVVVPTMMDVSKYKAMNHDEKLNVLKDMSSYIVNIANMGIKVGLLNTGDGVFTGTVILPLIYNLYPELADKVGYAVNISEKSDGGIAELDFRSVNTVNIEPVVEGGNIVYDRSRVLIGNTYSEFVKFGYVPNMFTVAEDVTLPVVNNLASLCSNVISFVVSKVGGINNGKGRSKVMPGYHETGVGENVSGVGDNNRQVSLGFIDCLQMFFMLTIICLIAVGIALLLVLL